MYVEQDFVKPAVLELQAQRMMKNTILKHWPTTEIDGVAVLSKLYLYSEGTVQDHHKIYNLLGVKLADLQAQDWKGIKNYYLYFKPTVSSYEVIETGKIDAYVDYNLPLTLKSNPSLNNPDVSEWVIVTMSYEPTNVIYMDSNLSNEEILARVQNDPTLLNYEIDDSSILTALALLDTNETVFEQTMKVTYTNLTTVTNTHQIHKTNKSSLLKEANIEFKYRQKKITDNDAYTNYLNNVITEFKNAYDLHNMSFDNSFDSADNYMDDIIDTISSLYTQLFNNYYDLVTVNDSDIFLNENDPVNHNGFEFSTSKKMHYKIGHLTRDDNGAVTSKSGLMGMEAKTFSKYVLSKITSGYTKKPVKWWKKFIVIAVTVIIVIIAIVTAQPEMAGGAINWAAAATVLSVGSMAMMGIAFILAKKDPALSAYIGKMSTTLGYIATAAGVTALIQNLATKLGGEGLKEAAKEKLKEAGEEVTEESLKAQMQSMSLSYLDTTLKNMTIDSMQDMIEGHIKSAFSTSLMDTMQTVLNWATKTFQIYTKYIDPPADGLNEKSKQIAEQKKQLEDLAGPELKDKIDYTFSSPYYNIYDFNEIMQAIPNRMTQGKIDDTFNKYYNGTASKVEYRGYLG